MRKQIETMLKSPEGQIDGFMHKANDDGSAYEFMSIDGTLHFVIAKDDEGNWQRIGGTEPYLSSWTDELANNIPEII